MSESAANYDREFYKQAGILSLGLKALPYIATLGLGAGLQRWLQPKPVSAGGWNDQSYWGQRPYWQMSPQEQQAYAAKQFRSWYLPPPQQLVNEYNLLANFGTGARMRAARDKFRQQQLLSLYGGI